MDRSAVDDKKALRKEIRGKLKQLTRDEIKEQSDRVWQRLFSLSQYQQAKSVGLFLSMPTSEICTEQVCKHALAQGKAIYVPQVGQNFEQADMELVQVVGDAPVDGEPFYFDWPRNKWGIPEPPEGMPLTCAQPGEVDLIVVPGLAFDRKGNRLGQGKGYYDRFLLRMMAPDVKPPLLVAVGLDCQLANHVPTESYDKQMDMLLLPSEGIDFSSTR
jgi:5-formyltetrahydrofolate cyclo-ligase